MTSAPTTPPTIGATLVCPEFDVLLVSDGGACLVPVVLVLLVRLPSVLSLVIAATGPVPLLAGVPVGVAVPVVSNLSEKVCQ